MNPSILHRFLAKFKIWLLVSVSALGLIGCGGGGGGGKGSSAETVIAPESLDQVSMSFFGAFNMQCYRLSGTAGTEHGAVKYNMLRNSFRYAITNGNSSLGYTIFLPAILTNVQYDYVRTSANTGRVTFLFNNYQDYPNAEATATDKDGPLATGDMFWGGRNRIASELVLDILFTDQGGVVGNTTTRIRSGYLYYSTWTGSRADNTEAPFDFDAEQATSVTYSLLTGGGLPVGYNPYSSITDKTPSSAVWTTFQGRTVYFDGSDRVRRTIGHQSTGGTGPLIPGEKVIEESGTILVDERDEQGNLVQGVGGTYSYTRTGGDGAKFAISYSKTVNGVTETVSLVYDLKFATLDSGEYLDSMGVSGAFQQDLLNPH